MEPSDEFLIDDLLEKVKKDGLGLRTLLTESLTSGIFRSR